ncbi:MULTISPECIES: DUF4435 domain-containing protein [Proteus]|uniref:DUF4435 domain-containing protein n=1 Tax=Proteus TaxID=583 RepID=UPI0013782179|nr:MULTISPECIES: DUF4435 domain-containing protein [Proteus]NBL91510.1 DUF4435 domain-containing protein [Proteus sp. G2673]NBM12994.1 DUF4435 domain-containing protein [Proteus sp. G2670]NBM33377.1 DUF4435 domain-containing protein [Proteus sp. G2664]NBM68222.1 DUF4435 domain-containing protein [Proteus sp. G2663]NBM81000.1 DUF4435 domain-containing protein [Proteus sp. G2659]
MSNSFSILLPKKDNSLEEIETNQSVLIIGANGSGKSRLGTWMDLKSPQKNMVHRISAQRALTMPDHTTPTSLKQAQNNLLYGSTDLENLETLWYKEHRRWTRKPATSSLDDYDKLMVYLFSDKVEVNSKYIELVKLSDERVEPLTTKLDKVKYIWEKTLPHRELVLGGLTIQTRVKGNNDIVYNPSEMSDGERVIFYLIGQCLAAPENGIIIIDEPEIHLHKSVQVPLWKDIEKLRPDCLFVYMTHDTDFAAALHEAKKIWLKGYDGSCWDWEYVPDVEGLPESLLIEILGSRKPIVFVEGENGSYDVSLYRAVLNSYLVIPSGSCSQVIQNVKALRTSEELHYMEVSGIIDRDRRVEGEIQSLLEYGIYTLSVAEVENLFCVPEVITLVSEQLVRNPDQDLQSVKDFVFRAISSELDTQISLRVASEIKFMLNCFDEKAKGIDGLSNALNLLTSNINVKELYNESLSLFKNAVEKCDYLLALKLYNRKSLSSQVSKHLGLANGQLAELVVRMVHNESGESMRKALRPYFGEFSSKIVIQNT